MSSDNIWCDCKRCGHPIKRGGCPVCGAPERLNWSTESAPDYDCAACGREIEETDPVAAMHDGGKLARVNGATTGATLAYIHECCRDLYCAMKTDEQRYATREASEWEIERFVEQTQ